MKHPNLRRYIRHGTLVQLSVFETVARLGGFTKAAQTLHMAQPTVSMHIKRLTETVGIALFEASGRGVKLTDAGRELQVACEEVFQKIADVESRLAKMRDPGTARLRIAVSTAAKYFVPRLLARFWEMHPGVEVAVTMMNYQSLLNRLEADLDDFYIFSNAPADPEIVAHPLMANLMNVYARHDHPLANKKKIPVKDLVREELIMREPGSGTRELSDTLFTTHGVSPHVRMELGSNEAIKQAILTGIGVSLLSRNTVIAELRKGQIVALDVVGFPIERQWSIVRRKKRDLSSAARSFLDHTLEPETLRELADGDSH
jgi:LysR family transcriptional regulator, low CO2-responsive transcriptional regulator